MPLLFGWALASRPQGEVDFLPPAKLRWGLDPGDVAAEMHFAVFVRFGGAGGAGRGFVPWGRPWAEIGACHETTYQTDSSIGHLSIILVGRWLPKSQIITPGICGPCARYISMEGTNRLPRLSPFTAKDQASGGSLARLGPARLARIGPIFPQKGDNR